MATRPAWVSDKLFPFQSHFLEVDGAQVHYIDEGRGPVFLRLHGNPTWSFLYRHIVSGLKDRFRCIAPDYPQGQVVKVRARRSSILPGGVLQVHRGR